MKILTTEEHKHLIQLVRYGRLFEVIEWVEAGKSTCIPEDYRGQGSLIGIAIDRNNHSMVTYLLEHADLRDWERHLLVEWACNLPKDLAVDLIRLFIMKGGPLGRATSYDVFKTFNEEIILHFLRSGMPLRGGDGFADVLTSTGAARPLLKFIRNHRHEFPDLDIEGHIALKHFIRENKKRACALLTWAGIDPLKKYDNSDPYDPDEEYPYLEDALSDLILAEDSDEMLKAMKIKMTPTVWFRLFKQACWLQTDQLKNVCSWVPNVEKIIKSNPAEAARAFSYSFRFSSYRYSSFYSYGQEREERKKLQVCQYLAYLGTPCFTASEEESEVDYRELRSACYASSQTEELTKLFWIIYQKGDEPQRVRLKELVRTPKLQSIVKQHDPQLLRDLGIGSVRALKNKVPDHRRPWQMKNFTPPTLV